MEAFHGKVQFLEPGSGSPDALVCGNPALKDSAFARGRYCKNNFNDLASSLILLTELTVVNQWHDILSEERAWWGDAQSSFWEGQGMGPRSSTLAWEIPWTEEPGGLQSRGVAKSGTRLSD